MLIQKWRVHYPDGSGYQEFLTIEDAQAYASEIDSETIELIQETIPGDVPNPDWTALLSAIRGTSIFAKAYASGDYSLPAQNALTQLMNTISVTHELVDFAFFFNRLRETMVETPVGDYTAEELEAIASILQSNHFSLEGLNLD